MNEGEIHEKDAYHHDNINIAYFLRKYLTSATPNDTIKTRKQENLYQVKESRHVKV